MSEKPKTFMEAYEAERELPHPYASIQWKGTDVCMDVECSCGARFHVDGEFAFFVLCQSCHKTFAVGRMVELIEMGAEQEMNVLTGEVWDFWNE